MPPNRKGSPDLAQGLASLNVASFVVTSKYAPLTTAVDAVSPTPVVAAAAAAPAATKPPVESYWDWKSPKDQQAALEEATARDLFSVNHIEANLIAAAAANLAESATLKQMTPIHETHNYWFMPCDGQASVEVVEEAPEVVKKQGPLSHLVSAQHVQDNLQQAIIAAPTDQQHSSSHSADSNNYWQWSTFPERELSNIASAEQDRIQPMFACNHLQDQLVDQYGWCDEATLQEPSRVIATNDAYWVF